MKIGEILTFTRTNRDQVKALEKDFFFQSHVCVYLSVIMFTNALLHG